MNVCPYTIRQSVFAVHPNIQLPHLDIYRYIQIYRGCIQVNACSYTILHLLYKPIFNCPVACSADTTLTYTDIQIYIGCIQVRFLLLNRQRCIYINFCAVYCKKKKHTMIFRNGFRNAVQFHVQMCVRDGHIGRSHV